MITPYLIGTCLALAVSQGARLAGFDRDRAFYPTVLAVTASYYGLFAVMGGAPQDSLGEFAVIGIFLGGALVGFKMSPWFVVAGFVAHGVLDFFHDGLIANPGMPRWWPAFCLSYDFAAAIYLAGLLRLAKGHAKNLSAPEAVRVLRD